MWPERSDAFTLGEASEMKGFMAVVTLSLMAALVTASSSVISAGGLKARTSMNGFTVGFSHVGEPHLCCLAATVQLKIDFQD